MFQDGVQLLRYKFLAYRISTDVPLYGCLCVRLCVCLFNVHMNIILTVVTVSVYVFISVYVSMNGFYRISHCMYMYSYSVFFITYTIRDSLYVYCCLTNVSFGYFALILVFVCLIFVLFAFFVYLTTMFIAIYLFITFTGIIVSACSSFKGTIITFNVLLNI